MVRQASEKGLNWFQDVRFGMFIHWGLYSILAKEEWIMHTARIPVPEYEQLVPRFNPSRFNADDWVRLAADAGQKYLVITSRHHDGFSMYDTALSDYKVTNSPFGRDPIRELAEACARHGVRLGFYSSLLDWHHPAYRFREESGLAWSDYLGFLHGQVRELCTQYGEIACLWFDGHWPEHAFDETNEYFKAGGSFEYEALYDLIHELQPDAVILNNHHQTPQPGEDIQGYEQDLPGSNTSGWNRAAISDRPLEVCMTLNDHWGYSADDHNHKTTRHLIHTLVRSASVGANLLLNVGPTPEGEILPVHADRLRGIGAWLKGSGDSVYGTRAGILPPTDVSVSTRQGDTHYLHLLHDVSDCVTIPGAPQTLRQARLLADGSPVQMTWQDGALVLTVPETVRDRFDTVVVLS